MNEAYILKLINLVNKGLIIVDDIKNAEYKAEVVARLATQ